MKVVIAICAVLMVLLVGSIIVASIRDGQFYPNGLRAVMALTWGKVVLTDFSVSLCFTVAWVVAVERHTRRALLIGAAIIVLGNPILMVYLITRARRARSLRELLLGEEVGAKDPR